MTDGLSRFKIKMKLYAGPQIHFSFKDAETDHDGMEEDVSCNNIQKRTAVATLTLGKRDCKQKTVTTARCGQWHVSTVLPTLEALTEA